MYCLQSSQPIKIFKTDPPTIPVPKQVAFSEEGKVVVGGSDNGCIYVFDRCTGGLIETLHHAGTALVQMIAVCDVDGKCIIACATLDIGRKKAAVSVWNYEYSARNVTTSGP
ncbi:hypothetical protein JVT61DRAFT_2543 [Boletus reticuloceps]|uniref:Uncharacterized protein n=1 Tax=Boletus reticuloceps TaxID=495285 RepID=A0A8I2YSI0_9AGAM|nr:hypothetical protein JVT61DRAFT_2543 [Boletus reticuloceps]